MLRLSRMTVWFLFAFIAHFPFTARAQTITAATCNSNDVQTALSKVAADGTIVIIPAGSCTWTTTVTYKQSYSTVIMGQTICTGTPASSCVDNTILTDNLNRSGFDAGMLVVNTVSGKSFRLTGITFSQINGGTTSRTYDGTLRLYGSSSLVRIDHCHFNNINQTALTTDGVFGVIDHVVAFIPSEFMRPKLSSFNGVGDWGDNAFAQPTGFGTNQFIFLEDSTMTSTPSTSGNGTADCFRGGKFVVRHNILDYSSVQGHGTGHAGEDRGCRAAELYQNTFTLSNNVGNFWQFNGFFLAGGPAMIWGNTLPSGPSYYSHFVTAHINREDKATYTQTATPGGWGYCGTSVSGTGSAWDENLNGATGFACIDQVGRGMGDLLSTAFPNRINTSTGTIAWPRQQLEPIYEWNDSWSCTGSSNCSFWVNYDPGIAQNRDYFLGFNNTNCPANPGSNCTGGVGVGTLANRPTSCTPNSTAYPQGNSPGVGYWATDRSTLYVCTAANTWTAYYTPYTYPHPLVTSPGTPPAPPTGLQAVVN